MKKGIGVLLVMLILVGCSVSKENTGESSNEEQFSQMVGDWAIDFERTDPTIWGTGSSLGNEMVISSSGEFSYYIGITVGGIGQCEANEGRISVEIEPYEAHREEKEILTLHYENNKGMEHILMDWYGETVYWKRDSQSEEGVSSENLSAEESVAGDVITLTSISVRCFNDCGGNRGDGAIIHSMIETFRVLELCDYV